jgi:hypothetical protein
MCYSRYVSIILWPSMVTQYWNGAGPKWHGEIDRAKLIDDACNMR